MTLFIRVNFSMSTAVFKVWPNLSSSTNFNGGFYSILFSKIYLCFGDFSACTLEYACPNDNFNCLNVTIDQEKVILFVAYFMGKEN